MPVRICIAITLSVIATVSVVAAWDEVPDLETKPFLQQIAATQFEFSTDPKMFLPDYEPGRDYFFDAHELKHRRWFKPVIFTYWVYAAVRSYERRGEFRFKSYLGSEPTVNATFQIVNDSRAIFVPRKFPVILFPWGTKHRIDRLVAIQVTGGGGAISYAFTIGPRPVPFHKSLRKKEGQRN
ncbi:MAG: hypothetical protein AAB490_03575 [Patescibacteria group bacterium]